MAPRTPRGTSAGRLSTVPESTEKGRSCVSFASSAISSTSKIVCFTPTIPSIVASSAIWAGESSSWVTAGKL